MAISIVAPPARAQPPVLTTFTINGGAASAAASDTAIALSHTVVGTRPTEYRASRRADFAGASWLPYVPTPTVRDWYDAGGEPCDAARPSHRVTYFLQVRAALGEELKTADGQRRMVPSHVESNVLRASICAYATTGSLNDLPPSAITVLTQPTNGRKSMPKR